MAEIRKDGWLMSGPSLKDEEELASSMDKMSARMPLKTVMVYCLDRENMRKEPLGILTELSLIHI